MSEKYTFLSDQWTTTFQKVAQDLLDAGDSGPDAKITYKEYFPDAPDQRTDGLQPGISLKIKDGKVTIRSGVDLDDATDCTVRMAYASSLATMRLKFGPELTELNRIAREKGNLEIWGSLEGFPIRMDQLHDAMVDITA